MTLSFFSGKHPLALHLVEHRGGAMLQRLEDTDPLAELLADPHIGDSVPWSSPRHGARGAPAPVAW